ncbi:efflux RND transporter periplasmic adaptor subunit [Undibacterium cyanobacteriorum]|uniref:Efflux RND transporter periplasmic adaptor subunit n=1 Tax=Undibacterium cyanobacteriorum TaxID=3073561 RepID=A0ABY9RGC4_9BURK|nr:efflux RND transporter periplasmic adaptor subunit [Undibacterium sp. 20NA77.5]WMW79903.1 efflux RND transporter periplasmic adaptor subunit [Undibacterium sp. 20NA77.5]
MISTLVIAGGGYYFWKSKKGESTEFVAGQTLGAKPDAKNKPVFVNTTVAKKRNYDVKLTANGVVTSLNVVDVRSQVSSIIEKVHIKEGQFVRAGDVLFTLDNRADSVNLVKAQAQLDKELATLAENQRQLLRAKELFEKKFQSQSAVDAANTLVQAQKSVVDGAKAAVAAAKVSLGYTRIVAAVSGRTGIINVFPGSLVQPSTSGSALVTITQMDPIAVAFPLPQRNLSDALDSLKRGDSVAYASLPDTKQQYKGKLQFIDNVVDATSGTVKAKAVFDNKEMKLWPGAFANVELSVVTLKDVIVIPQDAIVIGVNSNSVFVVDAEGKAAQKKIDVKYTFGLDAVVSGIDEGTKIVLEGKQNLRPGVPIKERADEPAEGKSKKGGKKDGAEGAGAAAAASAAAASAAAASAASSSESKTNGASAAASAASAS